MRLGERRGKPSERDSAHLKLLPANKPTASPKQRLAITFLAPRCTVRPAGCSRRARWARRLAGAGCPPTASWRPWRLTWASLSSSTGGVRGWGGGCARRANRPCVDQPECWSGNRSVADLSLLPHLPMAAPRFLDLARHASAANTSRGAAAGMAGIAKLLGGAGSAHADGKLANVCRCNPMQYWG